MVFVVTLRCATCETEARASPRNPNVVSLERSENVVNLDVVNRSANIGRSAFCRGCQTRPENGEQEDLNSTAVILDLQEFHSAILDCDAYGRRTCVQTVLYEFLERGGWSMNDLMVL